MFSAETRIWRDQGSTKITSDSPVKVAVKSERHGSVSCKRIFAFSRKPFQIRVESDGEVRIITKCPAGGRKKDGFLSESTVISDRFVTRTTKGGQRRAASPPSECAICLAENGRYSYPKRCNLCRGCAESTKRSKRREEFDFEFPGTSMSKRNSEYIEYLREYASVH